MYILLWSAAALADDGFSAYTVRGEGLPSEVEELVIYFVVICDYEASIAAAQSMTYGEGCGAAVSFFLQVWGVTS